MGINMKILEILAVLCVYFMGMMFGYFIGAFKERENRNGDSNKTDST